MIHELWIGPKPIRKYQYYNLLSVNKVYGIKPTLWIKNYTPTNDIIDICDVKDIPSSFLNSVNNAHPAIQSDYARLVILYMYGGVYLDTDILCCKPITKLTYGNNFTICRQSVDPKIAFCNAFMYVNHISNKHVYNLFIETHNTIQQRGINVAWGDTGPVILSKYMMSNMYEKLGDVDIIDKNSFYKYDWTQWQEWFKDNELTDDMYGMHLWAYLSGSFLDAIDDNYVMNNDNLYTREVRKIIGR
jgi:mannosyltransferase OCH1-like enzyme